MNVGMKGMLCVTTLLLAMSTFPVKAEPVDAMKKFFSNLATYSANYTQEKVYLHLDNNGYFPKETIWFKAYVLGAASLLPTNLSKVLYVELLTPRGDVVQRKILPIYNGRTYGQFNLDELYATGFYEIRAYTRAMLNWDSHYIFSRVIPIFEAPENDKFSSLRFEDTQADSKLLYHRAEPTVLIGEQSLKADSTILTFYPEGGHIIKDVANRVAFKLTNKEGKPLSSELIVYSANGGTIGKAVPVHEGMGMLQLPAEWTDGYVMVNGERYDLPKSKMGCALQTNGETENGLAFQLAASKDFDGRLIGVSLMCRGEACWFDTLSLSPQGKIEKTIPRKMLHGGIHQLTVFTSEGEVLAERMIWIEPSHKPLVCQISQNEYSYQPFMPVVLDVTVKDEKGNPQQSEFSISVQDVNGMVAGDGVSLRTEMLLCSDLKGYIHHPEYYFEKNDEKHQHALDLLLMVQGWRRYEWKEMAGVSPFVLKQPAEEGQIIDGHIQRTLKNAKTESGLNVNLMLMQGNRFMQGTAKTDDNGNFAMQLEKEFYDDCIGYFTVTNDKDARQKQTIMLNRNFSPDPVTYEPIQLQLTLPDTLRSGFIARDQTKVFAWSDTLPKIHYLPEAKVKEKLRVPPYGSRYTYMGGEESGKRVADLYYNLEDEMARYMDEGRGEPLLWDWLKERNPYFSYDVEVPQNPSLERGTSDSRYVLEYKLHDVILLIDGKRPLDPSLNILGCDMRSLIICEDASVIKHYLPEADVTGARPPVLFMLYSNLEPGLLSTTKKGVRATILHGYSKAEEFYSPNYRMEAKPTPEDVRRTLYWNPAVTSDENGKASIILFSGARENTRLHIIAQGISKNGILFNNIK